MVMPEWIEGIRFSLEQIRPFSALFGSGTAAQSVFGERAPLWLAVQAGLSGAAELLPGLHPVCPEEMPCLVGAPATTWPGFSSQATERSGRTLSPAW